MKQEWVESETGMMVQQDANDSDFYHVYTKNEGSQYYYMCTFDSDALSDLIGAKLFSEVKTRKPATMIVNFRE